MSLVSPMNWPWANVGCLNFIIIYLKNIYYFLVMVGDSQKGKGR